MPAMHERIQEDLKLKERQLWTALTSADPAHAVNKLCSPNANLLFPNMDIVALDPDQPEKNEKTLEEVLAPPFHRFDNFSLMNARPLVIDLMAGTITYRISAYRGKREYNATGSTTWAQGSDGEWRIVAHQETLL
jgi:hypothetical protein